MKEEAQSFELDTNVETRWTLLDKAGFASTHDIQAAMQRLRIYETGHIRNRIEWNNGMGNVSYGQHLCLTIKENPSNLRIFSPYNGIG
jgi:hypothetical protein